MCSYIFENSTFPYNLIQAAVAKGSVSQEEIRRCIKTSLLTLDIAAYCGSTLIDHAFKEFVRSEIGPKNLANITYRERYELQREFIERKEQFCNDESKGAQQIRLPFSVSQTAGTGVTGNIVGDLLAITR